MLLRSIERVLAGALLFSVCLSVMNVASRYGMGVAFSWADEVQVYIMVWIAFLGAAVASGRNTHLRMDLFLGWLPARLQSAIGVLETAAVLILTCFVALHSAAYLHRVFVLEQKSDAAGIPMWIPHGALVAGFGLMAVIAAWHVLQPALAPKALHIGAPDEKEL